MKTRDWYAWIDKMPPPPDGFHVTGEVFVSNPGVEAILCPKEPQGINPNILLLDLHLVQKPGAWPEVMTWVQARYDKIIVPGGVQYTQVEIFAEGQSIATVDVQIVV